MAKTPHQIDPAKEKSGPERAKEIADKARADAAHKQEMGERVAGLVLARIQKPKDFDRAEGHALYGNRYRVNVYTAHETPEALSKTRSIAKSFFVTSDGEAIIRSDPPLG